MKLFRVALLLALSLSLGGCFVTPGAFTSTLDLRRNGDFAFTYAGEIVFTSPADAIRDKPTPWADDKASCTLGDDDPKVRAGEAAAEDGRPCAAAEIAAQRRTYEADQTAKAEKARKEAQKFGAMFGYTPGDDAANRRLAETMMRYDGWQSVVYKGDGVFAVDYRAAGKLTQDLVFPLLPQADIIFPFVTLRRQTDGSVRVKAPMLTGNAFKGLAGGLQAMGGDEDAPAGTGRTRGSFTVTTDGDVLTNNTENGASAARGVRALVWEVTPGSEKAPEALIGLR